MNILYIINGLIISISFVLYKTIINITYNPNNPSKEKDNKQIYKEGLVLFFIATASNYIITEFFYNDYFSKIYSNLKPTTTGNNLKGPEVFTDKPGF